MSSATPSASIQQTNIKKRARNENGQAPPAKSQNLVNNEKAVIEDKCWYHNKFKKTNSLGMRTAMQISYKTLFKEISASITQYNTWHPEEEIFHWQTECNFS